MEESEANYLQTSTYTPHRQEIDYLRYIRGEAGCHVTLSEVYLDDSLMRY